VVTAALGQRWFDVKITGMEAHAGPTPMTLRQDALLAASTLVLDVNRIALERSPHARGTVGVMDVYPSSRNVIPGSINMTVDFRAQEDATLASMADALHATAAALEKSARVKIDINQVVYFPPQPFDRTLVSDIRESARQMGLSAMDVVSGAGHDAVYLTRVAPTAMIFVPCKDGISHNEIEDAEPAHLEAGCNVLLQTMLRQAFA